MVTACRAWLPCPALVVALHNLEKGYGRYRCPVSQFGELACRVADYCGDGMNISWKSVVLGVGLSTLVFVTVGAWSLRAVERDSQHWVLPSPVFMDLPDNGYVAFSGTIGGKEAIATPFNIFQGQCVQSEGVCRTQSVQKIGPNQLGSIDVTTFTIVKWTPDLIIAETGEDGPICVNISLQIRRGQEQVEYLRSPRSPLPKGELCAALEPGTKVWLIGAAPERKS